MKYFCRAISNFCKTNRTAAQCDKNSWSGITASIRCPLHQPQSWPSTRWPSWGVTPKCSGPAPSSTSYMLKACLAASRTSLSQYCADQNLSNPTIQESEREELKNSLVLTQESAAFQILLEICQVTEEELNLRSRLTDVQETQSAVCCYLHQAFIEDTTMTLAKLVHFQVKMIF